MTPILGIMASQISGHLYAPTGSMYHIASTTLSTATATVTFSSIPADYTHLQVRWFAAGTLASAESVGMKVNFNSDTGANYAYWELAGSGSAVSMGGGGGANFIAALSRIPAPPTNSSIFGASTFDILDYANTNKYKTTRGLGGNDRNGAGSIKVSWGHWASTTAITSMTFGIPDGGNFATYSSFSLYGVK